MIWIFCSLSIQFVCYSCAYVRLYILYLCFHSLFLCMNLPKNALTLSFLLSAYHMYYTLYRKTNPIHCTQTITCALQTHTTNRMWKICAKIRNSYSLCVANPFYSLNFLYDLFHFDKTKKILHKIDNKQK